MYDEWPERYREPAPPGGGANYTAEELLALKERMDLERPDVNSDTSPAK